LKGVRSFCMHRGLDYKFRWAFFWMSLSLLKIDQSPRCELYDTHHIWYCSITSINNSILLQFPHVLDVFCDHPRRPNRRTVRLDVHSSRRVSLRYTEFHSTRKQRNVALVFHRSSQSSKCSRFGFQAYRGSYIL
jgi:hypothetical protein